MGPEVPKVYGKPGIPPPPKMSLTCLLKCKFAQRLYRVLATQVYYS